MDIRRDELPEEFEAILGDKKAGIVVTCEETIMDGTEMNIALIGKFPDIMFLVQHLISRVAEESEIGVEELLYGIGLAIQTQELMEESPELAEIIKKLFND